MSMPARRPVYDPTPLLAPPAAPRASHYGGVVGDLLAQIEERLAEPGAQASITTMPVPEHDIVHSISIACGYIGFAAALGAVGWGLLALF